MKSTFLVAVAAAMLVSCGGAQQKKVSEILLS